MDEKTVEGAEQFQRTLEEQGIARTSALAFSNDLLAPHEFRSYCCEICDEDLPLFRMQIGRITCVPCQSNIEKQAIRR